MDARGWLVTLDRMGMPSEAGSCYVYILASHSRRTYVGVTNDLRRRIAEHRDKVTPGFASKYNIDLLVYYEQNADIEMAIAREKQIKGWSRAKKVELVERSNPGWRDLHLG